MFKSQLIHDCSQITFGSFLLSCVILSQSQSFFEFQGSSLSSLINFSLFNFQGSELAFLTLFQEVKSACLLYHIFLSLSSVFSKYFLFCFFSLGFALSDATFILYHTQLSLSSVFLKFSFEIFRSHFSFYSQVFLSFLSVGLNFLQSLSRQLKYYIIFRLLCQEVFQKTFGFLSSVLRDSLEAFRFA